MFDFFLFFSKYIKIWQQRIVLTQLKLETYFISLVILKKCFLVYVSMSLFNDCKLDNQSSPIWIADREHRQKIFEFHSDIWLLTSVFSPPSLLETINIWSNTKYNRTCSFNSWRDTNADLRISLYACVQMKAIPWKFRILKPKIYGVIYT